MPGFRPARHQALLVILCLLSKPARADPATTLAQNSCKAIAGLVDAAAPAGPVFIPSYPTADNPALRDAGFVYDNALAVIALLACHDRPRAARIGAALRLAAGSDRFWHDGRLRNAYRAGPVATPPALPGWWDAKAQRWDEDAYQTGTATGNVAWAALSLLALGGADNTAAAGSLMHWVMQATATPTGYAGGFFGEEPQPVRLGWLSTEHNVDAAAAFAWLARSDPSFAAPAARARAFVASMWDQPTGRFWLGTGPDGKTVNRTGSGIDAELWPLIFIADPPPDWQRARAWVRAHHATGGGYGFNQDPDGIWTEGTAQAALILADPSLFPLLEAQRAPGGLLYATPAGSVATGLALTPGSTTDDFRYFHLPHLGATAWSVLAATGTNPAEPPGAVAPPRPAPDARP